MANELTIVPFASEHRAAWNSVALESRDSWFWHTREWYEWLTSLLGKAVVADAAFAVMHDDHFLAIAPCMVFAGTAGGPSRVGADYPTPWPAFAPQLGSQLREEAERAVFAEYLAIASRYGAGRIELFGIVQADSFRNCSTPPANLALRHGYQGTIFDTQVIDLTRTVDDLWRDVRKGHKSAIKSGQKRFAIQHWINHISDDDFRAYQELHAVAAGRVTRSQATFDVMRDWIREGKALMVGARDQGHWVGFVYVFLFRKGAYYASACNHPDATAAGLPVGHALIWEAILRSRDAGIELLEMGVQTYPSVDPAASNEKLVSISRFKRGFGGFPMPRYQARLDVLPARRRNN